MGGGYVEGYKDILGSKQYARCGRGKSNSRKGEKTVAEVG